MDESIRIILQSVNQAAGAFNAALKDINRINGAVKAQGSVFDQSTKILSKHRTTLLAIGAAAGTAATAFTVLVKRTITLGDDLNALSQKTGVSVENLSTLSLIAKKSNLEMNSFATGLKFLAKAMSESADEGSEAAAVFKALKVNPREANGEIKDAAKFMFELSDAMKRFKVDANLTTAAGKLFGRDGFSWIPFIQTGSKELKEQQAEIRALGGEMSGKFAKDADAFNDSLINVGIVLRGAAFVALKELLPLFKQLSEAVAKNKEIIIPAIVAIVGAITSLSIAAAGFKAVALIGSLGKVAGILLKVIPGFTGLVPAIGFGATAAGAAVISFGAVTIALGTLTAVILAAVEAWKLYKAAQDEAAANEALAESTDNSTERLKRLVEELRITGKFTAEEAKNIKDNLDRVNASGEIDFQLDANAAVIKRIKEKATAEEIFAAAARAAAKATGEQAKETFTPAETPEQRKGRLEEDAAFAGTKAEAASLNVETFQAKEAAKPLSEQDPGAAIEQERSLALRAIDEEEFALKADLKAKDIEDDELYFAQKSNIAQQSANKRLQIEKTASDKERELLKLKLTNTADVLSNIATLTEVFGKKGLVAQKAFAIASAIINTAVAVMNALTLQPYPLGVAAAAVTAALGAVQIAKIAGVSFAEGGMVPGAPSRTDNRLATVASGEYIFDSQSVARVGPAYMAALHESIRRGTFSGFAGGGLVPRAVTGSSFAFGGLVGQVEQNRDSPENAVNFGFVDTRNAERKFLKSEGTKILIDQMQRRGNRVYA